MQALQGSAQLHRAQWYCRPPPWQHSTAEGHKAAPAPAQEEEEGRREALLSEGVHAALEHSVRGVLQYRSPHCAILTMKVR